MRNPLKRFSDYVIDRIGDRMFERAAERYGDDVTRVLNEVVKAVTVIPSSLIPPPPPEEPPFTGLRSV